MGNRARAGVSSRRGTLRTIDGAAVFFRSSGRAVKRAQLFTFRASWRARPPYLARLVINLTPAVVNLGLLEESFRRRGEVGARTYATRRIKNEPTGISLNSALVSSSSDRRARAAICRDRARIVLRRLFIGARAGAEREMFALVLSVAGLLSLLLHRSPSSSFRTLVSNGGSAVMRGDKCKTSRETRVALNGGRGAPSKSVR